MRPDICRYFPDGTQFKKLPINSDLSEASLEEASKMLVAWYEQENPRSPVSISSIGLLCSADDVTACASVLEQHAGTLFGQMETHTIVGLESVSWALCLGELVVFSGGA